MKKLLLLAAFLYGLVAHATLVTYPVTDSVSIPSTGVSGQAVPVSVTGHAVLSDNSDGKDYNSGDQPKIWRVTIQVQAPGTSTWTVIHDDVATHATSVTVNTSFTPNVSGTWRVGVRLMDGRPWYDPNDLSFRTYNVNVGTPKPVITSPTTVAVNQGASINYTITATHSPTSFSATNLPPGLSRSGAVISGVFAYSHGVQSSNTTYTTTLSASNASYTSDPTPLTWNMTAAQIIPTHSVSQTTVTEGASITLYPSGTANFGIHHFQNSIVPPTGSLIALADTTTTAGIPYTPDRGPGVYKYRLRIVDNNGNYIEGPQQYKDFTVVAAPATIQSVTYSPLVNGSWQVTVGQTASATVAAKGSAPLSYQWQKGGVNLVGATSATLNIVNAQQSDGANYTVTVSNGVGSPATSAAKPLSVQRDPPLPTTHPASQTVNQGTPVTFTAAFTSNTAYTVQWFKSTTPANVDDGVAITPLNHGTTLMIANPVLADDAYYYAKATNPSGPRPTNKAKLTVTPAAPVVIEPAEVYLNLNVSSNGTIAPTVRGATTYQWWWYKHSGGSPVLLTNGGMFSGTNTAALQITGATTALNGDVFQIIASNENFNTGGNGTTLRVGNYNPATFTQHPSSVSRTAGTTATFSGSASGSPAPTYRWQRQAAGTSTWADLSDGGAYSGTTTGTLSVANVTQAMTGDQYRLLAMVAGFPTPSNAATLTVTAPPPVSTSQKITGQTTLRGPTK